MNFCFSRLPKLFSTVLYQENLLLTVMQIPRINTVPVTRNQVNHQVLSQMKTNIIIYQKI